MPISAKPISPPAEKEVENLLQESGASFGTELIADRNWNEVWESNFEPIEVEGRCSIRAPFHVPRPDLPFDIVIMPKNGVRYRPSRHDTTDGRGDPRHAAGRTLRVGYGQRNRGTVDPRGKKKALHGWTRSTSTSGPMRTAVKTSQRTGSKTASRLGRAMHRCLPDAVTTSSWPISTATSCSADMDAYTATLPAGGRLVMSGILEADIPCIVEKAGTLGLDFGGKRLLKGWAAVRFTKINVPITGSSNDI